MVLVRNSQQVLLALVAAAALGGCSGTPTEVIESRQQAQRQCTAGLEAFEQGNYADAQTHLTPAVESGYLNLDQYCEAAVRLAVVLANAGQYDEAHALLDDLEQGAGNMDEVFAARSFTFRKQGKRSEATAAWGKARRLNRQIREF